MPITRRNPRDPDSPFITKEGMARMRPFKERHPNLDTSKVTAVAVEDKSFDIHESGPKQQVVLRLSRDVVAALRARGPNVSTLADELLRAGLKQ